MPAGAIVLTVALLSLQDALVKYLSDDTGLWQIWVLRSVVAVAVLAALSIGISDSAGVRALAHRWTIVRTGLLVTMWLVYSASLPFLSLAVAAAVYYTSPILITVFGAIIAKETIGSRRWAAVGFGFVGMLLILQPGAEGFTPVALLPFLAAVLYASAAVLTNTKCAQVAPIDLSIHLNLGFLFVGGAAASAIAIVPTLGSSTVSGLEFLTRTWQATSGDEWLLLAVLGVISALAGFGTAIAYQRGRLPVIATLDYSYLAFAAIWGLIIFGDTPNVVALCGMVVLAGAGIASVTARPPETANQHSV